MIPVQSALEIPSYEESFRQETIWNERIFQKGSIERQSRIREESFPIIFEELADLFVCAQKSDRNELFYLREIALISKHLVSFEKYIKLHCTPFQQLSYLIRFQKIQIRWNELLQTNFFQIPCIRTLKSLHWSKVALKTRPISQRWNAFFFEVLRFYKSERKCNIRAKQDRIYSSYFKQKWKEVQKGGFCNLVDPLVGTQNTLLIWQYAGMHWVQMKNKKWVESAFWGKISTRLDQPS
ncbi:MAG: hypothetical protein V4487_05700 [Chlamydiota bacterium]